MAHVTSMLEAAFIAWTYPGWNADRFGVPLGWTRDDRRQSTPPAEPFFEVPLAV